MKIYNPGRILNILTSIFLIFIFISCTEKKSDKIRIGVLNGPSAVSFIKLIDQPSLIENKQLEIIIKDEPLQIQALMIKDELDFAILPTVMAANLYNKGLKYRMMACPVWGTLYLITNNQEITDKNFDKYSISVFGQGGTADILVQSMLQKKGLNDVKLDYTYSTNAELSQAMLLGKVELAVVSEPMVSNLMMQNESIRIVSKLECEEYVDNINKDIFVQTAFLVNERFIDKYPDLLTPVRDAYSSSCNFINEQPLEAAKLMVKHKFAPNMVVARHSLPLCNIRYVSAFAINQEVYEYLNIFYQFSPKSIGDQMPDNNFIYQGY